MEESRILMWEILHSKRMQRAIYHNEEMILFDKKILHTASPYTRLFCAYFIKAFLIHRQQLP